MRKILEWNQLIGNTSTVNIIKNSLHKNRFPQIAIFSGTIGTGKSTSATLAGLQLTCENPNEGGPCMQCHHCKTNLAAIENSGKGINLFKVNVGMVSRNKGTVEQLIQEIFVLEPGQGNTVYILEEMHTMREDDQTALLEELDRMDANTYIIVCTSQMNKIISPLKSRAIKFNFSRLKTGEARLLFARTCNEFGINKVDKHVEALVLRYAKGVPRDIINLVEFIAGNNPTIEEIKEFLGQVNDEDLIVLLQAARDSIYDMSVELDGLLLKFTDDVVLEQLKLFVVNAILSMSGKPDELDTKINKQLRQDFDIKVMYKIGKILDNLTGHSSEADFKLAMINISLELQNRKAASIITDNNKQVSVQITEAESNAREVDNIKKSNTRTGIKRLDLAAFKEWQ